MRVLAFDTATGATAVALVDDAGSGEPAAVREARDDPPPGARPGHTRRLLALIEKVLDEDGEGWDSVDRLAVGVGPGTFTGLRIGVSTAHALARGRGIPLVGVSTLASLALAAREHAPGRPVVALLDARRGELFAAGWAAEQVPGRDAPVLEPCVLAPDALGGAEAVAAGPLAGGLAVGDGTLRYPRAAEVAGLEPAPEDSALHRVSAAPHCRLAVGAAPGAADDVQPSYLRIPDAEANLRP